MDYEVSVILPTYNVEDYIDECITSLLNQTYNNFEIIVVNDGSNDSTELILEQYSKVIDNMVVINQKNSGSAGGPRNIGVDMARGKYILFLDPDDCLPLDAIEILVEAAKKSESEVVCGNYNRFNSKRKWTNGHLQGLFAKEKIITFEEEKRLANTLGPCNKLYLKKFVTSNNIRFDESLRIGEDKIFVLKALALASKIHIIPNVIYNYRSRENTVSATQDISLKSFEESVIASELCSLELNRLGKTHLVVELLNKDRTQYDFIRYIDHFVLANIQKGEWSRVIVISKRFIKLMGGDYSKLTYIQRMKIYCLSINNRSLLEKVVKKQRSRHIYKCTNKGELLFKDHSIRKFNYVDKLFTNVNLEDLNMHYKIEQIKLDGNYNLLLTGWAFFKRIELSNERDFEKLLIAKVQDSESEFVLQNTKRPLVSAKYGKGYINYNWSGFFGEVSLKDFKNESDDIELFLELRLNSLIKQRISVAKLNMRSISGDSLNLKQRINSIKFTPQGLSISGWALIEGYNYKQHLDFEKYITFLDGVTKKRYLLSNQINKWVNNQFETNPLFKYEYDYSGWQVNIPYQELPIGNHKLFIELTSGDLSVIEELKYPSWNLIKNRIQFETANYVFKTSYQFIFSSSEYNREICSVKLYIKSIEIDNNNEINGGYIKNVGMKSDYWDFSFHDPIILLNRIRVTSKGLGFEGVALNINLNQIVLLLNTQNDNFVARYKCTTRSFKEGEAGNNEWNVFIPYEKIEKSKCEISILVYAEEGSIQIDDITMVNNLVNNKEVWKKDHFSNSNKIKFSKVYKGNRRFKIAFSLERDNKIFFIGILKKAINKVRKKLAKRRRMIKISAKVNKLIYIYLYRLFSLIPITHKKVVFANYSLTLSDDFKLMDTTLRKQQYNPIYIFGNGKSLLEYLRMAYHFATAEVIFLNSYYRHLYDVKHRKRTKFVQLWHAAGIFKRFGLLSLGKEDSNSKIFEQKAHHFYTHVIVSADSVIEPYSEAFGISAEKVMALGVPRTDLFFDSNNYVKIAQRIYELIPGLIGRKVILYAPTFRGSPNKRKTFRNQLDFKLMETLKEENYVIILKMHPSVEEPVYIPNKYRSFVYDVSWYSDINELFFITDVLITDYSSSIFEFSLFNKTIIFFAYDLEKYLNERGFYINYEGSLPGPIFKNTSQIVKYIKTIDTNDIDHSKFIEKYMNKIDGNSVERVLNVLRLN